MTDNNLKLLKYNQLWLEFGVLTTDILLTQVKDFESGLDGNTEHYRYRAFKNYLETQSQLSYEQIANLFELITIETDITMATSMALDILKRKSLNDSQFKHVSNLLKQIIGENMQVYIDQEIVWRQKR